tara:strand:+ start:418 stop:2007 length:1590 start_codon:yes stop_codon:yes gene_type:complete
MLEHRFGRHDPSQLELKLGYVVDPDLSDQTYRVEAFIFVPRVLAMTKNRYSKQLFYRDTATFIRLKTPRVALSALASGQGLEPWLGELGEQLREACCGKRVETPKIIAQMKTIGCIVRSTLRDESTALVERLDKTLRDGVFAGSAKQCAAFITRFQQDVALTLKALRAVGDLAETPNVHLELRDAWRGIDEYMSIKAEESLTDVLVCLDQSIGSDDHDALSVARDGLAKLAVSEYKRRRGRGFKSYAREGSTNEYLSHRRHVLKRFVSSVLYLDVQREETGDTLSNLVGMTAAAMAMLFATVAAIITQSYIGMSFSAAFITAMVLSYIVKDRIKEHGKRILGRRVSRWLSDHAIRIYDSDTGRMLGRCEENFSVREASQIERQIIDLRHADHPTRDAVDGRPETVLHYSKDVSLSSREIGPLLQHAGGLNDIIRFNIQRVLKRMDKPWEDYRYVDPASLSVESAKCARVYHMNIVLRLTRPDGNTVLERSRVILSRKGILRVDAVEKGVATPVHALENPAYAFSNLNRS